MDKIKIKSIRKLKKQHKVYDLSVKGNHNFFIGKQQILTHNCDYMTPDAQASLRNLMETFSVTTRFILTCNYKEKIIEPIISRTQPFNIFPPSKKELALHLVSILDKENIKYTDLNDIKLLIDATYPDIRLLINTTDMNSINGSLQVDKRQIIDSDFNLKLLELLILPDTRNAFTKVRTLIADENRHDFSDTYKFLYDNVDTITQNNVSGCIITISESMKGDALSLDKEINFMECIIKLLQNKNVN